MKFNKDKWLEKGKANIQNRSIQFWHHVLRVVDKCERDQSSRKYSLSTKMKGTVWKRI